MKVTKGLMKEIQSLIGKKVIIEQMQKENILGRRKKRKEGG